MNVVEKPKRVDFQTRCTCKYPSVCLQMVWGFHVQNFFLGYQNPSFPQMVGTRQPVPERLIRGTHQGHKLAWMDTSAPICLGYTIWGPFGFYHPRHLCGQCLFVIKNELRYLKNCNSQRLIWDRTSGEVAGGLEMTFYIVWPPEEAKSSHFHASCDGFLWYYFDKSWYLYNLPSAMHKESSEIAFCVKWKLSLKLVFAS